MDETPTGGKPPEKAESEATAELKAEGTGQAPPPAHTVPPPPPEEPYYNRPLQKRDWMLFALIAVSVIAVLLLAATISLAVVSRDGRGCGGCRQQFENQRPFGNPNSPGNQGMPRYRFAHRDKGQQGQPEAPQTTPSVPQPAPAPGQSP